MTAIMGRMATYSGKEIVLGRRHQFARSTPCPKFLAWDADTPTKPDANGRYPIAVPGKFKAV